MPTHHETADEPEGDVVPADPILLIPSISKENLSNKPNWISRFSGIFYSLTASFLFVCSTFIIKYLGIDLLDALISRVTLQTVATLVFALYKNYSLLTGTVQEISLQILSAINGAAAFFLFFLAVRYIELSDVNTLFYTRAVWAVILSIVVYRERPSIGSLIALPLTFLGVVFVTQPSFLFSSTAPSIDNVNNKHRILGYSMSVAASLTSAMSLIIFKKLITTSNNIKPSVLTFQVSLFIWIFLIANQFYRIFYLKTITSFRYFISWPYLLSAAVCLITVLATVLVQKAIKREHPVVFSLLGSADIIFALVLKNIFTSVQSNLFALLGSALVIGSVALIGISKVIDERQSKKKMRSDETENLNNNNETC